MPRFVVVTYDRTRRFAHVQYLDGSIETLADVAQFRQEIESQLAPIPKPVDIIVGLGKLTVKPAVAAAYDEVRQQLATQTARRAYRYGGSTLVRTKVLTSSTLHGQQPNLFETFDDAVRALEMDRAHDGT